MKSSYTLLLSLLFFPLLSQPIDKTDISYPIAKEFLTQLKDLLAIPNDANHPEDIIKNIDWCAKYLEAYGFSTELLETPSVPLLLGTMPIKKNKPNLLFYFHIDGQPTDSTFWFQESPYQAVLKERVEGEGWVDIDWNKLSGKDLDPEWRIFARSSSDDKSPFVMFLAALETMKREGQHLPYNLKIILDFEEEKGSPNLATAVQENKSKLASDQLLIFDGPKHSSNKPTLAFGARGITTMSIKVFGPTFPLHSGHYGNYAPNPALRLAKLLAAMKDEEGRVLIPGFYDGIEIDQQTRHILTQVPDNEKELKLRLGIGETDQVGANYQESIQYPSLNIRGMASAWTGKEARTIVPATALAEIDLRLVVESDGDRLKSLVKQFIESKGYLILDRKPTSEERYLNPKICQINERKVTKAFRTPFKSTLGQWLYNANLDTFGEPPIRLRTMGGTLPTSPFINTLNVPAVILPLVNSDNNQHSPNENLRLGNYFDGVKIIYTLLTKEFK